MDATKFLEALEEIAESKGISKEAIITALTESLKKAYEKQICDGYIVEGINVRVSITEQPAEIKMEYVRKVVEEVEDDILEISLEDANKGKKGKKYQVGDEYIVDSLITVGYPKEDGCHNKRKDINEIVEYYR